MYGCYVLYHILAPTKSYGHFFDIHQKNVEKSETKKLFSLWSVWRQQKNLLRHIVVEWFMILLAELYFTLTMIIFLRNLQFKEFRKNIDILKKCWALSWKCHRRAMNW